MRICSDMDGTIATKREAGDYENAEPVPHVIEWLRGKHAAGATIVVCTARGTETGTDWREVTERQLKEWGVPYSRLVFGKVAADVYLDDLALRPEELP